MDDRPIKPALPLPLRRAIALAIAITPALAAIWCSGGFVTQDGPAHLYNAHIIAHAGDPASLVGSVYAVRLQPLPNWAGHVLYLFLGVILPPLAAERAAASLTLIAVASATMWLQGRVTADRRVVAPAALAGLIGMNVTWLFGFTGFLLGAALFAVTLGVWWAGRERMTPVRAGAIAGLIVVGYFCHPVSLGLTAFGLVALTALTPAGSGRGRRAALTIAALAPLVPLGLIYRGLATSGGPLEPEAGYLAHVTSLAGWVAQVGWVDPLSLAAKTERPFGTTSTVWNGLSCPAVSAAASLILLAATTLRGRRRPGEKRGWGVIAVVLLLAGLLGPDTLGTRHGHYLPQRLTLLGLVALAAWIDFDPPGRLARIGRAGIVLALVLQSLFVWDYARQSTEAVGRMLETSAAVGRDHRVAAISLELRGRFRANPLMHADCLLGIGTGNVIWGNYETNHYYFPVQLRDADRSPSAAALEKISRLDGAGEAVERAELWRAFLVRHVEAIDIVIIDGVDPLIDAATARGFDPVFRSRDGRTQVWRRKPTTQARATDQWLAGGVGRPVG